jgi:hypothetical protein
MIIDKMRTYAPEGPVVMSSSYVFCSIGSDTSWNSGSAGINTM